MTKRFLYKVYNAAGTYIKTLDDDEVINEPTFAEEINSAGTELSLILARSADSYGEGTDVDFNFQIKIYVIDTEEPNGVLRFHGKITNYRPIYGKNEGVEVTLLSLGADLDRTVLDLGDSIRQELYNADEGVGSTGVGSENAAQSFKPETDVYMNSITLKIKTTDDGGFPTAWEVRVRVVQGDPNGAIPVTGTAIADKKLLVDSLDTYIDVEFNFGDVYKLTAGTLYYFEIITGAGSSSVQNVFFAVNRNNPYSRGELFGSTGASPYSTDAVDDLWFRIDGGTAVQFTRQDTGYMLRQIMAIYTNFGGDVSYDTTTIELTGESATYKFSSMTISEAAEKSKDLTSDGWHWYVNNSTSFLHLHSTDSTIDHKPVLGDDLRILSVEKRIEDLVNTIFFTGQDGLYKKFIRQASIDVYGVRSIRLVDQRVSNEDTALKMANAILDSKSAPEVRMGCEVIDSNISTRGGFDIEDLVVGDTISFRNIGAADSSLWDVMIWDTGYWDYNIKQLESFAYQIIRIEYSPGGARLTLANIQPNPTKRIEEVARSLVTTQTADNPNAAT